MIEHVAGKLGPILPEVVFVGGAITELLITSTLVQDIRATKDVDVIIDIITLSEYYRLSDRLRNLGFKEMAGSDHPICRWNIDSILVDIMPINPDILGFTNRWYAEAITNAIKYQINADLVIQLVSPPFFLATKFEAFNGRGIEDIYTSHDLEDILTLIDGRQSLKQEIHQSSSELQEYLSNQFTALIENKDFNDAIYWHFPGDSASQMRVQDILKKIKSFI